MRRIPVDVLVVAAVLGLAFGAVGGGTAAATPGAHPVPLAVDDEGRSVVDDDPSIVNGRSVGFDAWSPGGSPEVIAIRFHLASPGCSGVHADVRETDDSVTVDLREGTHPASVGRMCTMIVVPAALEVTLASPLGDRTVLSAS